AQRQARAAAAGDHTAPRHAAGGGCRAARADHVCHRDCAHGARRARGGHLENAGSHLMSKIEEALRRAQQERAQDPAVAGGAVPDRQERAGRTEDERQPVSRGELVGLTAAEEIAHMREERPRGPAELTQLRIIDPETADPRVADAFRQLRTSLLQKSTDSNFVLVVTSAGNEGGASFVALNLAVAIAFDESKTALLVNANLRNPSLDRLVQTEGEAAGLTDYLGGSEKEVRHIIHPIGVPRVRLIPSGRQSRAAAEYFTMPQLRHLLRSLRQRYRER